MFIQVQQCFGVIHRHFIDRDFGHVGNNIINIFQTNLLFVFGHLFFKLLFFLFQFVQQLFLLVSELCRLFVILFFHNVQLLLFQFSSFTLQLFDCFRNLKFGLHSSSNFIQDVECFVREFTVGDISIRQLNTSFNDFIGISHFVICFVFVPNIHQNLDCLSYC